MDGEIVFHLVAEGINQYLDIKFVRGRLIAQIGFVLILFDVGSSQRNSFFPQEMELIGAILHIVIVLHGHVQLVTGRTGDTQTGVGDIGRTHDDPTIAMFIMLVGEAKIEFSVQVLGGMDTHLQPTGNQVFEHLQNAFFHFGCILGMDDVFLESFVIDFLGFLFIGQHQQSLVVFAEDVVDVDADQYFDFGYIAQFLSQLEVTR